MFPRVALTPAHPTVVNTRRITHPPTVLTQQVQGLGQVQGSHLQALLACEVLQPGRTTSIAVDRRTVESRDFT